MVEEAGQDTGTSPRQGLVCQVQGCEADLTAGGKYCMKRRLCREHLKADAVLRRNHGAELWRFCQQCGKLEPISRFQGNKRSCSTQLERRRKAAAGLNTSLKTSCGGSSSSSGSGCSKRRALDNPHAMSPGEQAAHLQQWMLKLQQLQQDLEQQVHEHQLLAQQLQQQVQPFCMGSGGAAPPGLTQLPWGMQLATAAAAAAAGAPRPAVVDQSSLHQLVSGEEAYAAEMLDQLMQGMPSPMPANTTANASAGVQTGLMRPGHAAGLGSAPVAGSGTHSHSHSLQGPGGHAAFGQGPVATAADVYNRLAAAAAAATTARGRKRGCAAGAGLAMLGAPDTQQLQEYQQQQQLLLLLQRRQQQQQLLQERQQQQQAAAGSVAARELGISSCVVPAWGAGPGSCAPTATEAAQEAAAQAAAAASAAPAYAHYPREMLLPMLQLSAAGSTANVAAIAVDSCNWESAAVGNAGASRKRPPFDAFQQPVQAAAARSATAAAAAGQTAAVAGAFISAAPPGLDLAVNASGAAAAADAPTSMERDSFMDLLNMMPGSNTAVQDSFENLSSILEAALAEAQAAMQQHQQQEKASQLQPAAPQAGGNQPTANKAVACAPVAAANGGIPQFVAAEHQPAAAPAAAAAPTGWQSTGQSEDNMQGNTMDDISTVRCAGTGAAAAAAAPAAHGAAAAGAAVAIARQRSRRLSAAAAAAGAAAEAMAAVMRGDATMEVAHTFLASMPGGENGGSFMDVLKTLRSGTMPSSCDNLAEMLEAALLEATGSAAELAHQQQQEQEQARLMWAPSAFADPRVEAAEPSTSRANHRVTGADTSPAAAAAATTAAAAQAAADAVVASGQPRGASCSTAARPLNTAAAPAAAAAAAAEPVVAPQSTSCGWELGWH